jgi:hypothetical protein
MLPGINVHFLILSGLKRDLLVRDIIISHFLLYLALMYKSPPADGGRAA